MRTANGTQQRDRERTRAGSVTANYTLHGMQKEKFELLSMASEIAHPGYGAWLFDTWHAHNVTYFSGALDVIPIIWGLTPHGHTLGHFSLDIVRITLHTSLLQPKDRAWGIARILGPKFASDVMLHEMIHQAIHQRTGTNGAGPCAAHTSHNNPAWVAEVNRIAPLLGLPANAAMTTQKRVKPDGKPGNGKVTWYTEPGCMTRLELSRWPYLSRPFGYYEPEAAALLDQALNEGAH